MRCTNCGSEIQPGSRFCVNCGAPVEQNAAPAGMPGGMPAPQRAVVRQKKKMSPAILALIIVGVVGVMAAAGFFIGKYVLNDDPGSDKTASESKDVAKEDSSDSKDAAKEDSSDSKESTAEKTEDQETFPEGVNKNNVTDYDNILDKSKYTSYKDPDFSFLYPIGFFNNFQKIENGDSIKYQFTGTDPSTELTYEKRPEKGNPKDTIIKLSQEAYTRLYDVDDPVNGCYPYRADGYRSDDKKHTIHGIVGGYVDADNKVFEYNYYISDGKNVYSMCIKTDAIKSNRNGDDRGGYLVDNLYRKISVTNSTKDMASTYEEFMADVKNDER